MSPPAHLSALSPASSPKLCVFRARAHLCLPSLHRILQRRASSRSAPQLSGRPLSVPISILRALATAQAGTRGKLPALPASFGEFIGETTMKVAVIGGTGNVGSRLAHRLALAGVDVVLASRNPSDEKTNAAIAKVSAGATGSVSAATAKDAAESADALIIATPGYSTAEAWKPIVEPFATFAGVVLDASNPLTPWPELNISADQNTTSAAEELQKVLPSAKVFKAFNTLGDVLMTTPEIAGKQVQMLFAGPGDDEAAKDIATKVIAAVGFDPVLVGPIRAARNLESIAELWIHMSTRYGWARDGFAFAVQRA